MSSPRDSILHIADLHFWKVTYNPFRLLNKRALGNLNVFLRRGKSFVMENAHLFIDALAETGAKEILLTGDFSSTSMEEEFRMARVFLDALSKRGFVLYAMAGNHDVYTFESVRTGRFKKHFGEIASHLDHVERKTLPGGTPMIVVPTVAPNLISSRGRVTKENVQATAAALEECADPVIVTGHYPLLDKTPHYELTDERRLRNADALRKVLGESGKRILYVCGHVHRFSYVRDAVHPNLSYLSTGAFFHASKHSGYDGEFSRIHVMHDGFQVLRHVHTLGGGWSSHVELPS